MFERAITSFGVQSQERVGDDQRNVSKEISAEKVRCFPLQHCYWSRNNKNMNTYRIVLVLYLFASEILCESVIAIIGTNDIHGKAFPTTLSRQDTGQQYNYGGLVYMARLMDIIKQENPDSTLFLDAGDQYQGGIESSKLISSGQIMVDFYNMLGLKASSFGNHEFDFGPEFLFPYLDKKDSLNLAANLRSEKGDMNFLEKQKGSALYTFPNGIKIGVVGLSTIETPDTTAGFSGGKFPPYRFLEYKEIVMDESRKLRTAGANAVLIVSHVGDACPIDLTYGNWTKDSTMEQCPDDEMTLLLKSLPEGTVDGVIQGHRHRIAHHYVAGVPYMGTINGGYYFNVLYLTFNDQKKVVNSKIEGPIPVCEKVFENTGRCNYITGAELAEAGELVNWAFHNQEVRAYEPLDILFKQKWTPLMAPYLQDIVDNELELVKVEDAESPVANLFTNLIHDAVPDADFVILNPGGFRSEWLPGVIQYQHYYNMFPFENFLYSFELTGAELFQTLRVAQSGTKGFYQCWNIQMHVTLDNGKKGFASATFMDGTPIDPEATYKGVTIDFLLQGGDDFSKIIGTVFEPKNTVNLGEFKAILRPYLQDLGTIREGSLIDPERPRLIVN